MATNYSQNFTGVATDAIPTNWSTNAAWNVQPTSFAGGTSPELRLYWDNVGDYFYIQTSALTLASFVNCELSFKQNCLWYSNSFKIGTNVSTNGINWVEMWSTTVLSNYGPLTTTLDLSAYDGQNIYLQWFLSGDSEYCDNWYIDDILITGTELTLATITTLTAITNITYNEAICGGNVTKSGNTIVTQKGVCWDINLNPTIANNKTIDGSGLGNFSSNLTGLTKNTLYYVRAYATNSAGTDYGLNVSFTTLYVTPGDKLNRDFGSLNSSQIKNIIYPINVKLDFEDTPVFTSAFTNSWSCLDVDKGNTYGLSGYTFPGSNGKMSFIAFDPLQITPPNTGISFTPYSGTKCGVCFSTISASAPNNDWLFSPKVNINRNSKFSFMAKSFTSQYGYERFSVGVSTGTTNPLDFVKISPGSYIEASSTTWRKYEYSLNNYIGQEIYVGIQCVSNDAFIFMIDDLEISYTPTIGDRLWNTTINRYEYYNGNVWTNDDCVVMKNNTSIFLQEGQLVSIDPSANNSVRLSNFTNSDNSLIGVIYRDSTPGNDAVVAIQGNYKVLFSTPAITGNYCNLNTLTGYAVSGTTAIAGTVGIVVETNNNSGLTMVNLQPCERY